MKIISNKKPKITFTPEKFVDHQKNNRSGHLGHAMAECKDGSLIAFYSNCSGQKGVEFGYPGHSMFGWVEYKRSFDRGITWSDGTIVNDGHIGGCYYSNNLTVKGADGKDRLLVQYSQSYKNAQTDIMHAWVETE